MNILEKLAPLELRHDELEEHLGSPEVLSNPKKIHEVGKALAELKEIVTVGR